MNEIENIVKDYEATKEKYASKDLTDVDADDQAYYWRSECYKLINSIVKDLQEMKPNHKPVEVPKFVAEWIELCKRNATLSECLDGTYPLSGEKWEIISVDEDWIITENNEELLARAWLDGYTVAKEPLYYVYDKTTKQYLGYDRVTKQAWWLIKHNEGARAAMTESQIKDLDESYWSSAVPVEEETE